MARNRMIKPEFWSSETLKNVSRDARLTFIALWNFCDDYGFCLYSLRRILGDIYPMDQNLKETHVSRWIDELINEKLLIPVDYGNKKLLFVKSWGEHQTVQHKSKRCHVEIDDIKGVIQHTLESHEDLMQHYIESHAPKRKKKEKEKEERESNKDQTAYGEGSTVFLSSSDINNLLDGWGFDGKAYGSHDELKRAIEILDQYQRANNKKYKSHYAVLQGWVYDRVKEQGTQSQTSTQPETVPQPRPQIKGVESDIAYREAMILDGFVDYAADWWKNIRPREREAEADAIARRNANEGAQ